MRRSLYIAFIFCFFAAFQTAEAGNQNTLLVLKAKQWYSQLTATNKPSYEVFEKAVTGYLHLKADGKIKREVLTIVDFSKSSTQKRMWIIDMKTLKVMHHSLVAHGMKTGGEFAEDFSNTHQSYQSSLGFYTTNETYFGKHGLSLRLDGQEEGFNHNARGRAVVMHGADYVSQEFIKKVGRLGRSFGCPSIPMATHKKIINMVKGQSCLFLYHPDQNYNNNSKLLNQSVPSEVLAAL